MAKAIKKYSNGLSIRYLKKPKKFYITFGVEHIKIDGKYYDVGFETLEEAEQMQNKLIPEPLNPYSWHLKQ